MSTRYIKTAADATELAALIQNLGADDAGIAFKRDDNTLAIYDPDASAFLYASLQASAAAALLAVLGAAAGYKIARGEHVQVAASDTVATGLATVIAVISTPRTRTVKQLFFNASPGDQAGAPVAGSVLLTSQKPTAVNDVTPIDATDFTDNIKVDWFAIGT